MFDPARALSLREQEGLGSPTSHLPRCFARKSSSVELLMRGEKEGQLLIVDTDTGDDLSHETGCSVGGLFGGRAREDERGLLETAQWVRKQIYQAAGS
jgi:hypothetical protein